MLGESIRLQDVQRRLRDGEITATELTEHCLKQIDALDGTIHAWVTVDHEGALAAAKRMDKRVRDHRFHKRLHGIPVGVKDIVDVKGFGTHSGTDFCAREFERESTIAKRLRGAGAIILGKTVTTPFACFDPPPTVNPIDTELTPGGSSSGSAAGVASGMCVAAIGSQTGGSITRPASYCGVVGLKPTRGRVPLDGVTPVSFTLDHGGSIAASVEGARQVYEVIAGYSEHDPLSADRKVESVDASCYSVSDVGVPTNLFQTDADAPTLEAFGRACARLSDQSVHVHEIEIPWSLEELRVMHRVIMYSEAAQYHSSLFAEHRDSYPPNLRGMIEEGMEMLAVDYAKALRFRIDFQDRLRQVMQPFDALVMPATPTAAPRDLTTTGDPRFNAPWSLAGVPTVSVPIGGVGKPHSIQFVGHPFIENRMLALAMMFQLGSHA